MAALEDWGAELVIGGEGGEDASQSGADSASDAGADARATGDDSGELDLDGLEGEQVLDDDVTTERGFADSIARLLRRRAEASSTSGRVVPLVRGVPGGASSQHGGTTPASAAMTAAAKTVAAHAANGVRDRAALKGGLGPVMVPKSAKSSDPVERLSQHVGRPKTSAVEAMSGRLSGTVTIELLDGMNLAERLRGLLPVAHGEQRYLVSTTNGLAVAAASNFFTIGVFVDPPVRTDCHIVIVPVDGVLQGCIETIIALRNSGIQMSNVAVDMPEDLMSTCLKAVMKPLGISLEAIGPKAGTTILTIAGIPYQPLGEALQELQKVDTKYAICGGLLSGCMSSSRIFVGLVKRQPCCGLGGCGHVTAYYGILLLAAGLTSTVHPGVTRARLQGVVHIVLPLRATIDAESIYDAMDALTMDGGLRGVRRATVVALDSDVVSVPNDETVRFITLERFLAGDMEIAAGATVPELLNILSFDHPSVASTPWKFTDRIQRPRPNTPAQEMAAQRMLTCVPVEIHASSLSRPRPGPVAYVVYRAMLLNAVGKAVIAELSARHPGQKYAVVTFGEFTQAVVARLNVIRTELRYNFSAMPRALRTLLPAAVLAMLGGDLVVDDKAHGAVCALVPFQTGPVGDSSFKAVRHTATVTCQGVGRTVGAPVRIVGINICFDGETAMLTQTSGALDPLQLGELLAFGLVKGAAPRLGTIACHAIVHLSNSADVGSDAWQADRVAVHAAMQGVAQVIDMAGQESQLDGFASLFARITAAQLGGAADQPV